MMFRNTTSLSRDRLSMRGLSRREGGLPLHIGRALVSAKNCGVTLARTARVLAPKESGHTRRASGAPRTLRANQV
jgi:hypothetical protein